MLRLYLLSVHYRSPLTYTPESLEQARAGMARMTGALRVQSNSDHSLDAELAQARERAETGFFAAMDSDFNSAGALGQLYELVREINRLGAQAQPATLRAAQGDVGEPRRHPGHRPARDAGSGKWRRATAMPGPSSTCW